jgi:hypothetical protein
VKGRNDGNCLVSYVVFDNQDDFEMKLFAEAKPTPWHAVHQLSLRGRLGCGLQIGLCSY